MSLEECKVDEEEKCHPIIVERVEDRDYTIGLPSKVLYENKIYKVMAFANGSYKHLIPPYHEKVLYRIKNCIAKIMGEPKSFTFSISKFKNVSMYLCGGPDDKHYTKFNTSFYIRMKDSKLFIFFIKFKVMSRLTKAFYPETGDPMLRVNVILDNAEVNMEEVRCYKTDSVMSCRAEYVFSEILKEKLDKFNIVEIEHPETLVLGNKCLRNAEVTKCKAFVGLNMLNDGINQLKIKAMTAVFEDICGLRFF